MLEPDLLYIYFCVNTDQRVLFLLRSRWSKKKKKFRRQKKFHSRFFPFKFQKYNKSIFIFLFKEIFIYLCWTSILSFQNYILCRHITKSNIFVNICQNLINNYHTVCHSFDTIFLYVFYLLSKFCCLIQDFYIVIINTFSFLLNVLLF